MKQNFILFLLLLLAGQVWGQAYTQVTTTLTDGVYLLVGDATSGADGIMLNTANASPYINYTSVSNPGTTITTGVTSANEFTITVSGSEITIYNAAAGYASWGGSGNTGNSANFVNTTTPGDNETWTVSVSGGLWSLKNKGTPGRMLQWNSSATRFAAYLSGSGQRDLKLYKKDATCAAPSSQASGLTAANITTTSAGFSWSSGNGDASLLALRASAQAIAAPVSGTSYTANTDFSVTTGINTNNKVVYTGAGNSVSGISNLAPGTQYTATAYAYNTADNCYNTSGPAMLTFYTLSTAPAGQPASFNAAASAFNQVSLSFSAANTITNATGYLILQKANAPATGLPVNGTAYAIGTTVGDATVAGVVTSASAISQNINGLSGLNTYYYTIIPFNWNGSNGQTYNYNTTNVLTASATTPAGPSSLSDIISNAGGTFYTANIDYLQYQATTITTVGSGAVAVMDLQLRDGGSNAPDDDALPTQLTGLTLNYTGAANTIRKAALFDGATKVAEVTAGANSISFTGITGLSAADNSTKNFTLAVSFNTTVTDRDKLVFTVASATSAANTVSSQFAATNAGAAASENNTSNNNNRIAVTATKITFTTNASNTSLNAVMAPALVISALDINNNIDLDATGTVSLTSSGTLSTSPVTATLTNGQTSFNNVTHTALGTGLVLTAQSGSFAPVNSATFNIHTIPYATGDYRTTSDGNWPNTTGTWEVYTSSGWVPATSPARPASNYSGGRLYIQHNISTSGSFASPSISILENGKFTVNSSATIADLKVYSGGTFEAASSMTMAASATTKNVVVEAGGKFVLNSASLTSNGTGSSIWNGNEDFQSGSILEIRNWNYAASSGAQRLVYNYTQITPNANGYLFGNIRHYGAQTSTFGLTNGSNASYKLCENDLLIESSGSGVVTFATTTVNVEVGGNLIVNSGTFSASVASSGLTHKIKGNLEVKSGATFRINQQNIGVNSYVFLEGDLLVQGTLEGSNPNTAVNNYIVFNKTGGTQSVDIDGTLSNHVYFQVYNAELVLAQNLELTNTRNILEVMDGSTLNFNGFNITGQGSFINASGGMLKITSPQGITGSGAAGNVQTTVRTYNTGGTYMYVGGAGQATGNGVPASVANVVVNNANGVQLSQPTTITGNLSLQNGLVGNTATHTLTLAADATITGGNSSSYINGPVTLGTNNTAPKTLPLGKNGVYAPVVLTPAASSSATFVAEYFNGTGVTPDATTYAAGSEIQSVDDFQYWNVSRSSGSAGATLNLPFQASSNIPDLSRAFVAHYNGAAWENAGNTATTGTVANGTVTSAVVNAFSPFTVGVLNSTPLPLGPDDFNVTKEAAAVRISWHNAAETPGSQYLVARSADGKTFETIATVAASGKESRYTYEDRAYKSGDNYYRLTLVDRNGTATVSKVKQIFIKAAKLVEVYPNPASGTVKCSGLAAGDIVNVYNATGVLVRSVKALQAIQLLDLADLPGGNYNIRVVQAGKTIAVEKLVIIK